MITYHKGHEICVSQYNELVNPETHQIAPFYEVLVNGEFLEDGFFDATEAEKAAKTSIDQDPDLF